MKKFPITPPYSEKQIKIANNLSNKIDELKSLGNTPKTIIDKLTNKIIINPKP